jgi:tetratricopeptide (TPR) repeat protein
MVLLGCGSGSGPGPAVAVVAPPHDLDQVDQAVREQFDGIWADLQEAESGSVGSAGRASAWGTLGQWFHTYKYSSSAAECYGNARRLDPTDPRWPYYLGMIREDTGDLEGAWNQYSAAIELDPESVEARIRLADLALRRQDLDRAEEIYTAVYADHPTSPGALFGLGQLALLRGDPAGAREPLAQLIAMQPEAAQVHYALARVWRQLGDEQGASEHLAQVPDDNLMQIPLILDAPWHRAVQLMDRGARTLTRRGVRAFRKGEHGAAARYLGRAAAADPEGPEKRINYGVALRENGYWVAAEEELIGAVQLSEEGSELRVKAHVEMARLLMHRRRLAEARQHLEAALAIDDQSLPARLELGRLHQALGKPDQALAQYAAVRSIDRALVGTRFWHAALLMALGRHQEALTSLEEDLAELGSDRGLQLLLARVLSSAAERELRDLPRARQLLAGVSQEPDVLSAETAAMVAAAGGSFDEAVAWERAALATLETLQPRRAAHIARRRLELYRRGEACSTPWEEREPQIVAPVTPP